MPSAALSLKDQVSSSGSQVHFSDEQQQLVIFADTSLIVDKMIVHLSDQDQLFLQSRKQISVSQFFDYFPLRMRCCIMTVTPGLIFHHELRVCTD
ncbi:hypothetical protein [Bartonella phoceensis]|uniref:hypothetical protein n=1 Tax=Bartonella phoceensis TaxID=270249 RepID=UPI001ABA95E6|nr:hypothetical protein [Bartonella phoceensis]